MKFNKKQLQEYVEQKINGLKKQAINESSESCQKIKSAHMNLPSQKIKSLYKSLNLPISDNGKISISNFNSKFNDLTDSEKYIIAEYFAESLASRDLGLSWDDLPDINSLHDCYENASSVEEIFSNVKEALNERKNH